MIVLDDATHAGRGIERKNQQRVAAERTAQSVRAAQPVKSYQVDAQQPAYSAPAPHVSHSSGGGGGGALEREDIVMLATILGLVGAAYVGRQAMKRKSDQE
jgi:Ca-activated chloride channel family protein